MAAVKPTEKDGTKTMLPSTIVKDAPSYNLTIRVSPEEIKQELAQIAALVGTYLEEGDDFGYAPWDKDKKGKKCLWKPGAEKLGDLYMLRMGEPKIEATEDWTADPPLFDYRLTVPIESKVDGRVLGYGVGSCSTYESRYKYRQGERVCPSCDGDFIIKGKPEYAPKLEGGRVDPAYKEGGWLCYRKKGGCGASFADKDQAIIGQATGRMVNPDTADMKNTALKMGKKRAFVDGIITVTRSSGIFTQDLEDMSASLGGDHDVVDAEVVTEKKPEPPKGNGKPATTEKPKGGGYATKEEAEAAKKAKEAPKEKPAEKSAPAPPKADVDPTMVEGGYAGDAKRAALRAFAEEQGYEAKAIGPIMREHFDVNQENLKEVFTEEVYTSAMLWFAENPLAAQ